MIRDDMEPTSTRPYLIRALHEWCTDNGYAPHIAVRVDGSVNVPMEYVRNSEIVLNVSFDATNGLRLGNEFIEFKARFGGVPRDVVVPTTHVIAIYARENGQGMAFPPPDGLHTVTADPVQMTPESGEQAAADRVSSLRSVPVPAGSEEGGAEPPPDGSGRSGGRPQLKRVK
ncbi:ClpXP protease specificity-enhancing factor [Hydrogenophaga luteola]|uniref:ClpXP protease specificity-enhancing factor n=1 Tax=Hydrogenophaga luteola TaxID=1591122 RepID=A0ABV7W9X9_9BURK